MEVLIVAVSSHYSMIVIPAPHLWCVEERIVTRNNKTGMVYLLEDIVEDIIVNMNCVKVTSPDLIQNLFSIRSIDDLYIMTLLSENLVVIPNQHLNGTPPIRGNGHDARSYLCNPHGWYSSQYITSLIPSIYFGLCSTRV